MKIPFLFSTDIKRGKKKQLTITKRKQRLGFVWLLILERCVLFECALVFFISFLSFNLFLPAKNSVRLFKKVSTFFSFWFKRNFIFIAVAFNTNARFCFCFFVCFFFGGGGDVYVFVAIVFVLVFVVFFWWGGFQNLDCYLPFHLTKKYLQKIFQKVNLAQIMFMVDRTTPKGV